jgi:hypothetical protein
MSALSNRLFQSAELRQELKINPRLYQAMELLYMPLLDLQAHLKTELAENPFLELTEADASQEVSLDEVQDSAKETSDDEIDWDEILLNGFEPGGQRRGQFEEKEFHEATPVEESNLRDLLMVQLNHLPLGTGRSGWARRSSETSRTRGSFPVVWKRSWRGRTSGSPTSAAWPRSGPGRLPTPRNGKRSWRRSARSSGPTSPPRESACSR